MSNRPQKPSSVLKGRIDWGTVIIPFLSILALCLCFILAPDASKQILGQIRTLFGDTFGLFYLIVGLGVFLLSIFLAFSKYGTIRLGKPDEKPKYGDFTWSSMMFTAGLAADILFYSFCEWILYANDPHLEELGSIQIWSSTYPIFHWGPIPWSFYLVLAVCFGFMLHVRGCHKQKYSEACRPLLGDKVDRLPGKLIDLLALFALLAGTATTFALATPLMAQILSSLFHLPASKWITIAILVITCIVYTHALLHGMKGISLLSASCMYLFFALLAYVLFAGGETRYILETGFSARAALKLVNTVLLLSGGEERPATLDLCLVDLYSGVLEAMKLGAPASFVIGQESVEALESETVPAGVLNPVEPVLLSRKLWDGDLVVMVSDGILDAMPGGEKEGAFRDFLGGLPKAGPQETAEMILAFALSFEGEPRDDMTVLVGGMYEK